METNCPGCKGYGKVRKEFQDREHGTSTFIEDCPQCNGRGVIEFPGSKPKKKDR